MNEELFAALGLSKDEAGVYTALIRLGEGQISDIARESSLHRPAVYRAIASLVQKDLITISPRGKRKVYRARSPKRMRILYELRTQEVLDAIAELEKEHKHTSNRSQVQLMKGVQGMRSVLQDKLRHMKTGGLFYRYDAYDDTVDYQHFRPKDYNEHRDQLDLEQFVITNATLRKAPYKNRMNCASKVFPSEFDDFEYNISQTIYGDTVYFEDFDEEMTLVFKNQRFAEFQKRVFEMLYRSLPDG